MMRQGPTDAVLASTDLGEMKIPEPMMVPTMIQMPLRSPTWTCKNRTNSTTQEFTGPEVTPLGPSVATRVQADSCPRHVYPVLLLREHQAISLH